MTLWLFTYKGASSILMGETAFIDREIWFVGDKRTEWCSSQVNHDPEPLLVHLSCFTLTATSKDERK